MGDKFELGERNESESEFESEFERELERELDCESLFGEYGGGSGPRMSSWPSTISVVPSPNNLLLGSLGGGVSVSSVCEGEASLIEGSDL